MVASMAVKEPMFYLLLSDTERETDLLLSVPVVNFPGKRMIGPAFVRCSPWNQSRGLKVWGSHRNPVASAETRWISERDSWKRGFEANSPVSVYYKRYNNMHQGLF